MKTKQKLKVSEVTIAKPLVLENWPWIYVMWFRWRRLLSAVRSHCRTQGPRFGPSPMWELKQLTWRQLREDYRAACQRRYGRIRNLRWSVYPYQQGEIVPDYSATAQTPPDSGTKNNG